MTKQELVRQIIRKKSFLCVGLDTDIQKIPSHLLQYEDPVFEFNKQIIDATRDLCVAYKPNLAFYEALGAKGWESLEKTIRYIPEDIFIIADAKRGDIGNTSELYARAFFEKLNCDALTVAPYMGSDSVLPFLNHKNKWVILLILTSNKGALDFQFLPLEISKKKLFQKVVEKALEWGNDENMMFVVGATRGEIIQEVRKMAPNHFFLVPGVGAQGGSLQEVCKYGMSREVGLLINSSRSIIYAGNDENFVKKARQSAKALQQQMEQILLDNQII
ncbi:MAG: orotidine-5'-phosphate decarboxylase [Bacteroidetes bacterium]|nr:MAG: orotidine-5'-phosphate decarboxylase [Bacteroidota bacterium]